MIGIGDIPYSTSLIHWQKLKEKLQEEVSEFLENSTEEELADTLEVLEAIWTFKNIDQEILRKIQNQRATDRGHFTKRVILNQS